MIKYFKYLHNYDGETWFVWNSSLPFRYSATVGRIYRYDTEEMDLKFRTWGELYFWNHDPNKRFTDIYNHHTLEDMGIIGEITEQEFNNRMLAKKLLM
jgi:hypothetical protein